MKICFPVQNNEGLESRVYNHFGSAPFFVVINTETDDVTTVVNKDLHHAHGACNPMKAIDGQQIDVLVVGGIGAGALSRLNQLGIKAFQAQAASIRENINLLQSRELRELTMQQCCGGHSSEGGCAHH